MLLIKKNAQLKLNYIARDRSEVSVDVEPNNLTKLTSDMEITMVIHQILSYKQMLCTSICPSSFFLFHSVFLISHVISLQ
jgi:hypothetical protein